MTTIIATIIVLVALAAFVLGVGVLAIVAAFAGVTVLRELLLLIRLWRL
jgi:hypothetical protein